MPGYATPPGAYQVPVGGYPATGADEPRSDARRSKLLGVLSLVLALVATVVTPIIAAVAGYEIGVRVPDAIIELGDEGAVDSLAFLSPARDQVLWAEIAFWSGTLLGIAAIVLGIMAIARRRGRGQGIAGLVIAVIGPFAFFLLLGIGMGIGAGAGAAGL